MGLNQDCTGSIDTGRISIETLVCVPPDIPSGVLSLQRFRGKQIPERKAKDGESWEAVVTGVDLQNRPQTIQMDWIFFGNPHPSTLSWKMGHEIMGGIACGGSGELLISDFSKERASKMRSEAASSW